MKSILPLGVWFFLIYQFLEQYAYYGIKSILVLYLTCQLGFTEDEATARFHFFIFIAYLSVILGIFVDQFFGKFNTILLFSIASIVGHGLNAMGSITPINNSLNVGGLFLVATGVGGTKPSLMTFAGDQFSLPEEAATFHKFSSLFAVFSNLGGLISSITTPILKDMNCTTTPFVMEMNLTTFPLEKDCQCKTECTTYAVSFGVSGVVMAFATIIFLVGKAFYRPDHREKTMDGLGTVFRIIWCGIKNILRTFSCKDWLDAAKAEHDPELVDDVKKLFGCSGLLILYLPLVMFWALFDQEGSSWTIQAFHMDGDFILFEMKPEQMLLLSPLLFLIIIPVMDHIIYPLLACVNLLTKPLQRISTGGFLTALAFCVSGILQLQMDKVEHKTVHMAWQVPQYTIFTIGAIMVMVSIVEFSYNPEPECFKSLIQAIWLLTIALGNLGMFIQSSIASGLDDTPDNKDSARDLFLFSGLMVLSMVAFSCLSFRYMPRSLMERSLAGSLHS